MRQAAQLLLTHGTRVLLCRHVSGVFAGRHTGIFAPVPPGDAPRDALQRHAAALGLAVAPHAMQLRAIFVFAEADDDAGGPCEEHQFVAEHDAVAGGAPRAADGVEPAWWQRDALPFDRMPADDALWYARVLNGELLRGSFRFDGKAMLSAELHRVRSLP